MRAFLNLSLSDFSLELLARRCFASLMLLKLSSVSWILFLNLLFCSSGCNSFTLTSLEHRMVFRKEHCASILRVR